MRNPLLALAAISAAAAVPAQSWVKLNPAVSPSLRRAGAMAFDSTQNRLILYGGFAPGPAQILNETWSFNGTAWTMLNPPGGAPARWGHQMVRMTAVNRLLTFGGRSPSITALANDTWQWTGTAWAQVPTPTSPPPRFRYGLAYDSLRQVVILFGGRSFSGDLADTWEFDGITWTPITTANTPPPREDMVLVYDSALNRTVLFGGYDSDTDTLLGDTWEYDAVDWRQMTTVEAPTARFRSASGFDSVRKRVTLYGGFDDAGVRTDTWEYAGSAWIQVTSAEAAIATEMYSGYDSTRRKFVTFGGVGTAFLNETWEFTGGTSGILGAFGEGCPTSAGISEPSTATAPRIGQNLDIAWSNIPATTPAVIVVQGLSNVQYSGIPLPFELSILGLTQCNLLVSAEFLGVAIHDGSGTVTSTMAIPNDNTLINLPFYSQILIEDAAAFNGAGGASRGARSVFGT